MLTMPLLLCFFVWLFSSSTIVEDAWGNIFVLMKMKECKLWKPVWDSLRYHGGQTRRRYRRRASVGRPWKTHLWIQNKQWTNCLLPCGHPVEDEVNGLVEDTGRLVKLQLGLQIVVLPLHVHDHRIQELNLRVKLSDWELVLALLRWNQSRHQAFSKLFLICLLWNMFALIER